MKNLKTLKMICPNCESSINVDELLINQFEQSIRKDLSKELSRRESELKQHQEQYRQLSIQLEKEKTSIDELVNKQVKAQLLTKEEFLKESIRKEVNDEKVQQLQELENELIRKSSQLKDMNKTKAQLEVLRREMEEREIQIILNKEKELTERLEKARLSIREQVDQENFLKLKEREKVIEDLKIKLTEAQRQASQGSMQLQGIIMEQEVMELLQETHPIDEFIRSKTGANAADLLHIVKTKNGTKCGSIYLEIKRTKVFQPQWVNKLKSDNIKTRTNADILIIVSSVLPKGIDRYGLYEGIWVSSYEGIQELSLALRFGLLKVKEVAITQHNKGAKMELLYNYLCSEEFKGVFDSIISGFKDIQDLHFSEKLRTQRLWKQREKQLNQVLSNSIEFYGSLKGIAGNAIQDIKMLEYPKAS
ncbi:MAG: DUF2130 domain-containing protein [Vicingaceae bacterium]|nr:DUF2130 domain-containing protein [Vicingaceae bacterium]